MLLQSFTQRVSRVFCSALVLAATCVTANEFVNEEEKNNISREHKDSRVPAGLRSCSATKMGIETQRAKNAQSKTPEESSNVEVYAAEPAETTPVVITSEEESSQEEMTKGYYYTSHNGAFHSPQQVNTFIGQVTFEDGSLWSVKFSDTYKMANWIGSDTLVVIPNGAFSYYKYRIVNQNTLATINANLLLTPYLNNPFTYSIITTDTFFDKVWLNDGSVWEVTPFDNFILQNWDPNDVVIIGINDDYLHDSRPNVLINTFTNEFVRAVCTYKIY